MLIVANKQQICESNFKKKGVRSDKWSYIGYTLIMTLPCHLQRGVQLPTDCSFLWTPFHHCWKYCSGREEL